MLRYLKNHPICYNRCNNLPGGGYLCLCDRGYLVDENNPKKCVDFDECTHFGHNCTHSCTNFNGTFSCSCAEGFELTDLFSGVCKVLWMLRLRHSNSPPWPVEESRNLVCFDMSAS